MDPSDLESNFYGFDNIGLTLLYLIQVGTFDRWWTVFFALQYSEHSSLMINFIYTLTLVISLIIHGFLIANFMDSIILVKKKDQSIGKEYLNLQSLTSKFTAGLLAGLVGSRLQKETECVQLETPDILQTVHVATGEACVLPSEELPKESVLQVKTGARNVQFVPSEDHILHRQRVSAGQPDTHVHPGTYR